MLEGNGGMRLSKRMYVMRCMGSTRVKQCSLKKSPFQLKSMKFKNLRITAYTYCPSYTLEDRTTMGRLVTKVDKNNQF